MKQNLNKEEIFILIVAVVILVFLGFSAILVSLNASHQDIEAERQEKHIEQLESETYRHYDLTDAEFIETSVEEPTTYKVMTPEEFRDRGVIEYNGWKFTYYSEQVLPGEGLKIPGRHSDEYFVRDKDGFLCVASNEIPMGEEVDTPFGIAKVYDTIGDGVTGVCDIYVSFN